MIRQKQSRWGMQLQIIFMKRLPLQRAQADLCKQFQNRLTLKIKEWYQWLKSLHYTQKWFVILILLRPIIDNFYYLKAISPLVSPLYIVGVLTPILCLWSISKIKNYYRSPIDGIFGAWIVIVMLNFFFVFLYNLTDIKAYETFFQYIIFFVIYYFSRRMIKTEKDQFDKELTAGNCNKFQPSQNNCHHQKHH